MNEDYFAEKINGFVALCPVAILKNTKSTFLRMIARNKQKIWQSLSGDSLNELYGKDWEGDTGTRAKQHVKHLRYIRKTMIPAKKFDDQVRADVMLNHFPHGSSLQTMMHLAQLIEDVDGFRYFNYMNPEQNIEAYGTEIPPEINIYQSKIPVAIFAAENDKTVELGDVKELISDYGDAIKSFKVYPGDHLTFQIGKDEYINDFMNDMLEQIQVFNNDDL